MDRLNELFSDQIAACGRSDICGDRKLAEAVATEACFTTTKLVVGFLGLGLSDE